MSRTAAVIQVRVGSTRFPGKALTPLAGKPLTAHILDRVKTVSELDAIILAFPDQPADRVFFDLAAAHGVEAFAGPLTDVLARFQLAVAGKGYDQVVRICADNPLIGAEFIPEALARHRAANADWTAPRGLPLGAGFEVIRAAALAIADREATAPHQREHVTPFFYEQPERFTLLRPDPPHPYPSLRLTVDTIEDFRLQEKIFGALYRPGKYITVDEVVALLERHPEWLALNREIRQKPSTAVG